MVTVVIFRYGMSISDSGSTASVAGAILGTALGSDGIPPDWVQRVEDRDLLLDLADRLCAAGLCAAGRPGEAPPE